MSYTIETQKHNGHDTNESVLEVNVMRERYASSGFWDKTYNYIKSKLDDFYSEGVVPNTIVRKYDTDAVITSDFKVEDGNRWLDNNGVYGDGVYMWCVGANSSFMSEAFGNDAWNAQRQGFVGENDRSGNHELAVQGIHEAFHPYLKAKSCDNIRYGILNGNKPPDNSRDHALGEVHYSSSTGLIQSTHMLNHYGRDTGEIGNCNNYQTKEHHSRESSICTKDAMKYSWEHAEGQH